MKRESHITFIRLKWLLCIELTCELLQVRRYLEKESMENEEEEGNSADETGGKYGTIRIRNL